MADVKWTQSETPKRYLNIEIHPLRVTPTRGANVFTALTDATILALSENRKVLFPIQGHEITIDPFKIVTDLEKSIHAEYAKTDITIINKVSHPDRQDKTGSGRTDGPKQSG